MLMTKSADATFRLGLMFALGSALTFGLSGPLAKSLMTAGWSCHPRHHRRSRCGAQRSPHSPPGMASVTGDADLTSARGPLLHP